MSGPLRFATPREVLHELERRLTANDKNGFADLLATDGVVEWPFMPAGLPNRVVGREALQAFNQRSAAASRLRYDRVVSTAYDTSEPEVIVTEQEIFGTDTETGFPFKLRAIVVLRVHDGEIVLYRDYVDPLAVPRILGRLPQLFELLTGGQKSAKPSD